MKKDNRGISIVKLLVIIVLLIVIVFIVFPIFSSVFGKGKGQKCAMEQEDIMWTYHVQQAGASVNGVSKESGRNTMKAVMEEKKGTQVATDQYKGICGAGGILTFSYEGDWVSCSIHPSEGKSHKEVWEVLKDTKQYVTLLQNALTGSALYSTEPSMVSNTVSAIEEECRLAGVDISKLNWKIVKLGEGNYDCYITDADIEHMNPGETVMADKYNTLSKKSSQVLMEVKMIPAEGGVSYPGIE